MISSENYNLNSLRRTFFVHLQKVVALLNVQRNEDSFFEGNKHKLLLKETFKSVDTKRRY